ncbi:acyl-CoA thioesterase [Lentzea sp. BCCO 10_0856]|uniref:Acyl-CoA thioesterase n=1 Tax=Lentzea miocenica TaxID=3095431 RepID=A0ABU4TFV1_9PSEU|nr:acyl-CoA thioesterase [Lentzea sp. BCCO 10_0856]MDX8037071.1 acyl-CoA thioesterase [Lentzea sp. BCCO 10_0856]
MRAYRWNHVVTFDETNLVGNVYFTNFLRWQGHCREMFLAEFAPGVLAEIGTGALALATVACDMEYYAECFAFDRVEVAMTLRERRGSRVRMDFDFLREGTRVAKGSQTVACLRRTETGTEPVDVPPELADALAPYEIGRSTAW